MSRSAPLEGRNLFVFVSSLLPLAPGHRLTSPLDLSDPGDPRALASAIKEPGTGEHQNFSEPVARNHSGFGAEPRDVAEKLLYERGRISLLWGWELAGSWSCVGADSFCGKIAHKKRSPVGANPTRDTKARMSKPSIPCCKNTMRVQARQLGSPAVSLVRFQGISVQSGPLLSLSAACRGLFSFPGQFRLFSAVGPENGFLRGTESRLPGPGEVVGPGTLALDREAGDRAPGRWWSCWTWTWLEIEHLAAGGAAGPGPGRGGCVGAGS